MYRKEVPQGKSEKDSCRVPAISAGALKARMDRGEILNIIDIRLPHELAMGSLPGAVFIPLAKLISAMEGLDPAKETVLVCKNGENSEIAAIELLEQGYKGSLVNLAGGMNAWARDVNSSMPEGTTSTKTNLLPGTISYPAIKVSGKNKEIAAVDESVIEEMPLTIFFNGHEMITILASVGEEEFLTTGFLASEGIIKEVGEIKAIKTDELRGIVSVETYTGEAAPEKLFLKRYLTACCGKGRSGFSYASDAVTAKKVTGSVSLTLQDITNYSQILESNSKLFQATGAVHGGALVEGGRLIFFSFDIGRHNVFDKIYGRCLVEGISTQNKIMVFTGRVSSEILIKLSKMNISIIIARSAPTSLALNMAEAFGITVIGFARGERMNIYTHAHRVIME